MADFVPHIIKRLHTDMQEETMYMRYIQNIYKTWIFLYWYNEDNDIDDNSDGKLCSTWIFSKRERASDLFKCLS